MAYLTPSIIAVALKALVFESAPTCTDTGLSSYTCSVCGDSYTEEKAALNHSYKDGVCANCGEEDPDYVAPVEKFNIAAAQVIMGNNLDMMFAIPKTAVANWEGYYAQIVHEYADGRADDVQTIEAADFGTSGGYYTVTYKGLAAKEMADTLKVTVYNAQGEAVSNVWVDSIRAYAMRNFDSAAATAAKTEIKKTMIVDMLNYGAEAQKKFGYNTGDLANNLLTAEQQEKGTQDVELAAELEINHMASQLMLESNISFWIAFKGIDRTMKATIEFTDHYGKTHVEEIAGAEFGVSGSVMYVASKEVVIADARQILTITVYNADGSVFVQTQDSIADYLARSIEKPANANSKDLYYAIMKFADSAEAYLHA